MKIIKRILIVALSIVGFTCFKPFIAKADTTFSISAKSCYLMDYDSQTVVYQNNETERLPIASMTKIMLLDIVFEKIEQGQLSMNNSITVSKTASGMGGSQVFLQADKKYLVKDLIKCVIVASANDASVALAEEIAGSEDNFVSLMNKKAQSMGLINTLFSNCTGLPKLEQYSSAQDVAKMFRSLIRHEDYFKFSKIWLDELTHPDGSKTTITNTNKLVKFYDGCDGGKTGFTNQSKFCLVATAKKCDTRLIAVVIGEDDSKKRFSDVSQMFNTTFKSYKSIVVVDKNQPLTNTFIKKSSEENIEVYPKDNLTIFSENSQNPQYTVSSMVYDNLVAPLQKGDKVGEVILFKDGVEILRTDLILNKDVNQQTFIESFIKSSKNWKLTSN